jgi:hypothetical protein
MSSWFSSNSMWSWYSHSESSFREKRPYSLARKLRKAQHYIKTAPGYEFCEFPCLQSHSCRFIIKGNRKCPYSHTNFELAYLRKLKSIAKLALITDYKDIIAIKLKYTPIDWLNENQELTILNKWQ